MKTVKLRSKVHRLRQLAAKVAEAQSKATSARVHARVARLAFRNARKIFKEAKRLAKEAAKQAKQVQRKFKSATGKNGVTLPPASITGGNRLGIESLSSTPIRVRAAKAGLLGNEQMASVAQKAAIALSEKNAGRLRNVKPHGRKATPEVRDTPPLSSI